MSIRVSHLSLKGFIASESLVSNDVRIETAKVMTMVHGVQFGVLLHELSAIESPQQRHLRQLTIPDEAPVEIADLINRYSSLSCRRGSGSLRLRQKARFWLISLLFP